MLNLSLKELSVTGCLMDWYVFFFVICWIVSSGNAGDIYHLENRAKTWYEHVVTWAWSFAKNK